MKKAAQSDFTLSIKHREYFKVKTGDYCYIDIQIIVINNANATTKKILRNVRSKILAASIHILA